MAASAPDPSLQDELLQLLRNGGKIEAIKRVREFHQCSLREAKERVDSLASGAGDPPSPSTGGQPISDAELDEVLDLLASANRLAAIKMFCSYSGWTLKESKEFIENLEARTGGSAVESQKSGCLSALVFMALVFAGAAKAVAALAN